MFYFLSENADSVTGQFIGVIVDAVFRLNEKMLYDIVRLIDSWQNRL